MSKGSYNYNPAYIQFEMCEDDCKHKDYFEAVYKTAVDYCVYLCEEFNIPVENIVSHKEAHDLGYGSNHGDPNNWWDNFGRTMDDFRAAVKAGLSAGTETATMYCVQVGEPANRADAEALAAKLKAAGFDARIVSGDGAPAEAWTPAVGDKVLYRDTVHYRSANATEAYNCTGGEAVITEIYKLGQSKHPYHLKHTGKGCTVNGYVDAGTFDKA